MSALKPASTRGRARAASHPAPMATTATISTQRIDFAIIYLPRLHKSSRSRQLRAHTEKQSAFMHAARVLGTCFDLL